LHYIIFSFVLALVLIFITVAHILNETYALGKTSRTLMWGSHRPLHGAANIKSLVANDETGFKVLTLKDLLESSKVNRQPTGKCEIKFKE
jgi:queuine/archaeosine tRNA-ribosyltransferase